MQFPPLFPVLNQPTALADYNAYTTDPILREGVRREGADWADSALTRWGERTGSAEMLEWGRLANLHEPVLRAFDRFGHRIDEVEFHPAWHHLMKAGVEEGQVHAWAWRKTDGGGHVARAASHYLLDQAEAGVGCPLTMTFAAVPALRHSPAVAEQWIPKITSVEYDFGLRPPQEKRGCLVGMAMTEKQGGSDVRANTTRAEAAPGEGEDVYSLFGHKWFCSAPMCDGFLTLAQTSEGLTCFLLPRIWGDGRRNRYHVMRLKEKLGNRSNASSEVEFHGALARRVGALGRGVPTIIEMVNHTRLDCVIGSTALMRQALVQAIHHVRQRSAFGKLLAEQPLMDQVLSDLALESEAATTLMLRLARGYDQSHDSREAAFVRLATAVAKYWICKRTSAMVGEALECLGGGGYVEESITARLYREAPLASIWEGSGNVMCLDVLRALAKTPQTAEIFLSELELAGSAHPLFDALLAEIRELLSQPDERWARRLTERLALGLQASLLLRHSPRAGELFCQLRLRDGRGHQFGAGACAPQGFWRRHWQD